MSRIKSILGGHEIIAGASVENKIRRMQAEWDNYKKYNENNIYNEELLLPLVSKLFLIENNDIDSVVIMIKNIFSDDNFEQFIEKIFELQKPVEFCLRDIFFLWRDFIEKNMLSKLKTPPRLEAIDSSSPIIYFLATDRDSRYSSLRQHFKNINYNYIGFCNLNIKERLIHLLQFPINSLFKTMPNSATDTCAKIKSMKLPTWSPSQKFNKFNIDECENIIECIDHLLDYFEKIQIHIQEKEDYYVECAKIFEKIAAEIKEMLSE